MHALHFPSITGYRQSPPRTHFILCRGRRKRKNYKHFPIIMPSSLTAPFIMVVRLIPRNEVFGNLIEELTQIVERQFPGSSPLVENSVRTWTFIASRYIYSYTNDVISGSLAVAVLISFLISRHAMPMYVFVIWALFVVSYLMAAILEN